MGSAVESAPQPWIETPCIFNAALSKVAGCNIHLKLECLQPSGSFKSRGVGNLMVRAVAQASKDHQGAIHFYCSSGGNAGLACATAARDMGGLNATIVVPVTTSEYMVGKLKAIGADVVQHGANWGAADAYLREVLMEEAKANGTRTIYVPPFDHPDVWTGASTLVDELEQQGLKPDGIVCSVGGGGLMCGLLEGMAKHYGDKKTPLVCVETDGTQCLMASVEAGEIVTLPAITSVATSLGSPRIAAKAFEWHQQHPDMVKPLVVDDAAAVDAIVRFLDDTRLLVEPACGAALAPVYTAGPDGKPLLRGHLGAGLSDEEWAKKSVVVVVCGGSNINLDILANYRNKFGV